MQSTNKADHGDAPWFHDLPEQEAASFFDAQLRAAADLTAAADFLGNSDNKILFPVSTVPMHINYFVLPRSEYNPHGPVDGAAYFNVLADRVRELGGSVHTLEHDDTVQHYAELPFGSGRVVYRVVWIEREDASTDASDD